MAQKNWRLAGINFDHFHMGDLLRMAIEHSQVEIVGICDADPARMAAAQQNFGIESGRVFTDPHACLEQTKPDAVILCPATAGHAEWTELVAPYGAHILMEKPFADSLASADRMAAAAARAGIQLAINWPMRWYPAHVLAYELAVVQGRIGQVQEVHYYDGNRGPLYHGADKIELEPSAATKAASWFYKAAAGGGSLLDYLGYGTTLGTWYLGGRAPLEVSCTTWGTPGLEVDEQCVATARYETGLSVFQTRWGTFTDPWTHQPQPMCGFVLKGSDGTISCYDNASAVRLQTRQCPAGEMIPAPPLAAPGADPVQYFLHCLETGRAVEGPLSLEVSRTGQQIVDCAVLSAREGRVVPLHRSTASQS